MDCGLGLGGGVEDQERQSDIGEPGTAGTQLQLQYRWGRWALGSVSGGTLQPRHAALLGDAARQRRGAGRPLLVVRPRPRLGDRDHGRIWQPFPRWLRRCRCRWRAAGCKLPDGLHTGTCTPSGTLRCSVDGPVPRLALDVRSGRSRESEAKESTITAKKPPPPPPPPPPPARLSSASRRVSIRVGRQSSVHLLLLPSSPIPADGHLFLHLPQRPGFDLQIDRGRRR